MINPTGIRKVANQVKGKVHARRGPAEKDQSAAPIADAMVAYWKSDSVSFGIPAHSGGRGPAPEFTRWAGIDAARMDLPLSHGVDRRDRAWQGPPTPQELFAAAVAARVSHGVGRRGRAWQVQATAQELLAEAGGADQTLFSTHGSSMNGHVALMTVVAPGEKILMPRKGHKSSFAGLVLTGA